MVAGAGALPGADVVVDAADEAPSTIVLGAVSTGIAAYGEMLL